MDVDRVVQRVLVGAGGLLVGVGVLIALTAGGDPTPYGLPFGSGAVGVVGVLGLLLGLVNVRDRLRTDLSETVTPDPERPANNPTPGADVDRMLYEMTELRQGVMENREQLEGRLRRTAVAVIRDRNDCSEPEAVRMLQTGEWTDDEVAAAFFREDATADVDTDEGGGLGLETVFSGGSDDTRAWVERFRSTVDTLIEVAEIDRQEVEATDVEGVATNWNVADSSVPSFDTDEPFEDVSIHRTNRWLGVTAFGLIAAGVGIVASVPGLMLAGTIGIAYAVYGRLNAVPPLENLAVERELSETETSPGEEIQVTVTVRNEGGTILPNLRLVDAVPDAFVVTRGTPRLHTALRPGASASFQYTVMVERGEYEWPLLTIGRDFSGGVERASLITPDAPLRCTPPLTVTADVPVREQTTQYAGDVETKTGGSGLEFFSVREYRKGDPMNRINWRRLARSGELATIDFRKEQAATITILFDTRQAAYVSQGTGKPHAVDLSVHAASDVFGALYDAGNLVGIAAFDTVPCWHAPGAGTEHLERARLLFAQHPALSPRPPERQSIEGGYIDPMTHVRRRLPSNSQIFLFTPLVDDYAGEVARRLDSAGHLVTVISPDVTADRTVGERLTHVERTTRIRLLREQGMRVIDWDPDGRLDLQFQEAQARWGR